MFALRFSRIWASNLVTAGSPFLARTSKSRVSFVIPIRLRSSLLLFRNWFSHSLTL